MNEKELRKLIEKASRLRGKSKSKIKKMDYLMDFGKISTLVKISDN
jgi:hypothetical protein